MLDRLLFNRSKRARGGKRGQKGEPVARTIARRIRMAWEGKWGDLWGESCAALPDLGQREAKTRGEITALDIKAIEEAMAEGDESGAARVLSERVKMAPEAKARRVLPQFFPRAAQALPTLTQENASRLVDSRDIESFMKAIDKQVAHAPKRKGPGWGGSVAEFWHWAVKYSDEWAPIRQFLLQLALAMNIAPETYQAYASARILAADRDEPNKVRPLGLGAFSAAA